MTLTLNDIVATLYGDARPCTHTTTHPHGSANRYNHDGCRCPACREAVRVFNLRGSKRRARERWAGRSEVWADSTGTLRRLEALHAAGWTNPAIARVLGCSESAVGHITRTTSGRVTEITAAKVRRAYDYLSTQPNPTGWIADRNRRTAAARGWAPPLMWDDDDLDNPQAQPAYVTRREQDAGMQIIDQVAVDLALSGHPPTHGLTGPERRVAESILTQQGASSAWIARCLGCNQRTVTRYRAG